MDRPSVFGKCLRGGSVSIVLASILLTATVFAQVGPTQNGPGNDDGMMQHLVQYFMRVGTEQYERGYYIEAEKTFQMAQGYADYLEPLEQRKLDSMLEKAGLAAIERKRVLDSRRAAEQMLADGRTAAGQAELARLRDSEFLTDQEQQAVAELLRGAKVTVATPVVAARAESAPSDQATEVASVTSSRPGMPLTDSRTELPMPTMRVLKHTMQVTSRRPAPVLSWSSIAD